MKVDKTLQGVRVEPFELRYEQNDRFTRPWRVPVQQELGCILEKLRIAHMWSVVIKTGSIDNCHFRPVVNKLVGRNVTSLGVDSHPDLDIFIASQKFYELTYHKRPKSL